ncbi:competence protein ComK [Sporosarcina highlanderae]|uniref:Competence protein ComK n=1 Tax=Sporosarcina highlanderae TaxID=3035916 RepID=A0ABT8JNZ5_9BACL|nr:competence protein ComK [Sporosarcina highlanderae]MDN4605879.1 competence protein ComK [Sporosarcina highlanderae]
MENGVLFKVGLGTTQLVDYSLRCYGSSLRGAKDGARMLLGEISMSPIVLGLGKKLYCLPTKSPYKEDCVWMAASHVKEYTVFSKKITCIVLNDNSEFILESSYYAFDQKMKRTFMLKNKVESQFGMGRRGIIGSLRRNSGVALQHVLSRRNTRAEFRNLLFKSEMLEGTTQCIKKWVVFLIY